MEVQYRLQAFGISIPVDQNGNLQIQQNSVYIDSLIQRERREQRSLVEVAAAAAATNNRKKECSSGNNNKGISGGFSIKDDDNSSGNDKDNNDKQSPSLLIDIPNDNDVLLQRGKKYQAHYGNVQLTKLVEKYRAQYNNAQRQIEKTTINQLIVQLIHESNGRFLMRVTTEDNNKDKDNTGNAKWKEVPIEVAWERVARRYRK